MITVRFLRLKQLSGTALRIVRAYALLPREPVPWTRPPAARPPLIGPSNKKKKGVRFAVCGFCSRFFAAGCLSITLGLLRIGCHQIDHIAGLRDRPALFVWATLESWRRRVSRTHPGTIAEAAGSNRPRLFFIIMAAISHHLWVRALPSGRIDFRRPTHRVRSRNWPAGPRVSNHHPSRGRRTMLPVRSFLLRHGFRNDAIRLPSAAFSGGCSQLRDSKRVDAGAIDKVVWSGSVDSESADPRSLLLLSVTNSLCRTG